MRVDVKRYLFLWPIVAFVSFVFLLTVMLATPMCAPKAGEVVEEPSVVSGQEFTRFVVFGDQGKGNESQFRVGNAMAQACAARGGCDFGVTVGDNFYPSGVRSVDDPKWITHFEEPYAPLDFPIRISLGNHDYGARGFAFELWRVQPQIDYTEKGGKWRLPARVYRFSEGPVDFLVLNTTPISFGALGNQPAVLDRFFEESSRPWQVVVGHHPYLSNGKHDNAGNYDQVPWFGEVFKRFFEENVCGRSHLYLAGHDHNLQDLHRAPGCATELLISGGGADTTPLRGDNPTHYQSDQPGFVMIEAHPERLELMFFDENAELKHQRSILRSDFSL